MGDDAELFAHVRERLFTAVIGDVMDREGLRRQFLPSAIRPLERDMVVVGRAMTVLEEDIDDPGSADPFGLMFRALDDLRRDEVYICTGAGPTYALWGGLMSTRAKSLGAAGAVLDGFHRDTREIRGLGFPVFSAGAYAQDQRGRGRVRDFRCPITFPNGAIVTAGDLIVGDVDGVLTVPAEHVTGILRLALEKVAGEDDVRRLIESGEGTQSIFDRTGIM